MKTNLRPLKEEASKLSQDDLLRFNNWCVDLFERRERESKSDDSQGINPRDLLKEFRKNHLSSVRSADIAYGWLYFQEFYQKTRVKGCPIDEDADMLLVEWGPASKKEFSFRFTRQVVPPAKGEQEIWQLTLELTYPLSEALRRIKSGNQWFRDLHKGAKLGNFVVSRDCYKLLRPLKPSHAKLSYENVE